MADTGVAPIRFHPIVRVPMPPLRPSSRCKAGWQVGVIINWRGDFRRSEGLTLRAAQQHDQVRERRRSLAAHRPQPYEVYRVFGHHRARLHLVASRCSPCSHAVRSARSCSRDAHLWALVSIICVGARPSPPMLWAVATTTSSDIWRGAQQPRELELDAARTLFQGSRG